VNQTGAINVFDAARAASRGNPVPVVYASSAAVYGKGNGSPCSEADATRPLSPYGADKLGCELHARIATRVHGVPTRGFRLFNVYGPRQNPSSPYAGVISRFAKQLDRGMPIDIHGDGGQVRDFVYVKDAVLFLIAGVTARLTTPEIFNVCTGRPIAINQLARMLASIAGRPLVVHHGASRPDDIRMSTGDPSKALLVLQVRAETNLFVGLQRTLEWMRSTPADEAPEAGAQGARRWQAHVPA